MHLPSAKPAPRRRWLRISLLTLAVVAIPLGIWVGWNAILVHERNAMRYKIRKNGGTIVLHNRVDRPLDANDKEILEPKRYDIGSSGETLPRIRQLLGDERVEKIEVKHESEVAEARRLFPETYAYPEPPKDAAVGPVFDAEDNVIERTPPTTP